MDEAVIFVSNNYENDIDCWYEPLMGSIHGHTSSGLYFICGTVNGPYEIDIYPTKEAYEDGEPITRPSRPCLTPHAGPCTLAEWIEQIVQKESDRILGVIRDPVTGTPERTIEAVLEAIAKSARCMTPKDVQEAWLMGIAAWQVAHKQRVGAHEEESE